MKKTKLFKTLLILFVAFSFSNCEEDGAIQFAIVDDFETKATVSGLAGLSTIDIDQSMDVSDLLDNASTFVEADVESVIVTLEDYSGNAIEGTFDLKIGSSQLFNQTLVLTANQPTAPIEIPANSSDILSSITSGIVQVDLSGSTTNPIADNNFTLNLKFKIKAVVE